MQVLIWMILVWQIMDDLLNLPNFPPAKLSHYTGMYFSIPNLAHHSLLIFLLYHAPFLLLRFSSLSSTLIAAHFFLTYSLHLVKLQVRSACFTKPYVDLFIDFSFSSKSISTSSSSTKPLFSHFFTPNCLP